MTDQPTKSSLILKLTVIGIIAAIVIAVFAFDLNKYLTLEALKGSLDDLRAAFTANPLTFVVVYVVIYALACALSIPGATILTLGAGGIMGLGIGFATVSVASTLGATLACIIARYLLRDYVQTKFGDRLATINKGIEREGGFYLLTMRLVPAFPFFVVNLAMGLTPIKLSTYAFVSWAGMIPGTLVYVNAGTALAEIESTSDILSARLILSFLLLATLPMIMKWTLKVLKQKQPANNVPA